MLVADRSVCVVDYLVKVLDRHKTVTTTSITHRPPFLLILPQQTHHITLGNCQVSWVLTSHTHTPTHTRVQHNGVTTSPLVFWVLTSHMITYTHSFWLTGFHVSSCSEIHSTARVKRERLAIIKATNRPSFCQPSYTAITQFTVTVHHHHASGNAWCSQSILNTESCLTYNACSLATSRFTTCTCSTFTLVSITKQLR